MEDFLLRVEHVSKHYSGHTALDDVSLDIPRGSVYGLLGPNGAGKTTLIRIINRITAPDEGRVLFDGRPLASADVQRIGYLPEERGLYKKMKVGEQALFFARLKGLSRAEAVRRLRVWFDRFDIASWWNRRVEELSKVCATTGVILSAHTSLCIAPIMEYGNEEQKKKYLPKLASGEWLGAFGLTEPNAGTDANNQTTTAVKEGDHWVLNGSKIFITNAGPANVYFVIAVTGRNPKGVECAAFIVEKGFPGFSVGKKELKMGIRGSSTCELIFENCIVPEANLVGKIGEGVKMALKTLDGGRVGISAQALGIAELSLIHI